MQPKLLSRDWLELRLLVSHRNASQSYRSPHWSREPLNFVLLHSILSVNSCGIRFTEKLFCYISRTKEYWKRNELSLTFFGSVNSISQIKLWAFSTCYIVHTAGVSLSTLWDNIWVKHNQFIEEQQILTACVTWKLSCKWLYFFKKAHTKISHFLSNVGSKYVKAM